MIVTKYSSLSGKRYSMNLDITQKQLDRYNKGKELVQNIFPDLNRDEREFLISGIAPKEWEETFNYDNIKVD
jgi:hypothetical protein